MKGSGKGGEVKDNLRGRGKNVSLLRLDGEVCAPGMSSLEGTHLWAKSHQLGYVPGLSTLCNVSTWNSVYILVRRSKFT